MQKNMSLNHITVLYSCIKQQQLWESALIAGKNVS